VFAQGFGLSAEAIVIGEAQPAKQTEGT